MKKGGAMFTNLVLLSETDRKMAEQAIEIIIDGGAGGRFIDKVVKRDFRMTTSDHVSTVRKKLSQNDSDWRYVYDALQEWHETWMTDYQGLRLAQLEMRLKERPVHTWTHFLMTGDLHVYREMTRTSLSIIDEEELNEMRRMVQKSSRQRPHPHEERGGDDPKIKKLELLYDLDEETRVKVGLLGKKIAIFLDDVYPDDTIREYEARYHLSKITQYPAVSLNNFSPNHDYYIFLTSKSSHSSLDKLYSKVARDKVTLCDSRNIDRVFETIINRLKGRI